MIPSFKNPLHLYRALLRAASSLFNTAAQDFHTEHIRWSFRRQQINLKNAGRQVGSSPTDGLPSKHESQQLRRGRQYLSTLQRANQGYIAAIEKVLRSTYARSGKRRRALMQEVLTPAQKEPVEGQHETARVKIYSKNWRPPEKFTALLKSQERIQNLLEDNRKLKLKPELPTINRWGRPLPECRKKNIWRKWYSKQADTLLPPLSEKEWSEIYRATSVTGGEKSLVLSKRRPVGQVSIFATASEDAELQTQVEKAVMTSPQSVEPQQRFRARQIMGNPHVLTPRFVRRIMQRVVLQSAPIAVADGKTGKLAMRWDTGPRHGSGARAMTDVQKAVLFD